MSEPFDGLVAIIQYRGKMGVSPRRWKAMAAFDVKSLADDYLKDCASSNRPWEYRLVEVEHLKTQDVELCV